MSRTNRLRVAVVAAFVLLVSACSQAPPDTSASPMDNGLVDTATNGDSNTTLPGQVQRGVGAFVVPGDMDIDNWTTLEFVVGPDQAVLAEETEGRKLSPTATVYVAPTMRVTLLPDPNFQFQPQSDPIQDTGADRTATWQWKVKPLHGGDATLFARVEVGERRPDGSLGVAKTYTRRVGVHVTVGTWKGFVNALKSAASVGDVVGTLVGSIGKTVTSIAAIVTAGPTVWLAIQAWRKRKKAKATEDEAKPEAEGEAKPKE
jgi:hypothetical protein